MLDTHNKLQYRNNYNHWKILDIVLDFKYFSFSNPNGNPNQTHLPKHQTLSPNHQFSQHIWQRWSPETCVAVDCIALNYWGKHKRKMAIRGIN